MAYAQQAAESAAAQQSIIGAEQLSQAFRSAAKAVRPSVVRINAMVKPKAMRGRRMGRPDLPPGFPFFFDDQFFRDFDQQESQNEAEPKEMKPQQAGVGSGFIVSSDGYILTNNHVVQEADQLEIQLSDGRRFDGKVIGTDDRSDVAVVKIEASNLVPAKLGDSTLMDVGDWVIAVGSPFELDQTVTAGIISALNRSVEILDYEDFLQTDAAINPGNSGGPLVNLRGEVIGINTAINSRTGSNAGVGFAIPSSMARQIMESIIKNGRVVRGFIGATLKDLTLEGAREMKLPPQFSTGVLIEAVLEGGPAAVGGLKANDVIVRVNGRSLRDANALRTLVALTSIGQSINVTVYRSGKELELKLRVEEQTEDKLAKLSGNVEIPDWGMSVSAINDRIASRLGIDPQDVSGVVVMSVKGDGKAVAARLQPGDIIMKVNGKNIETVEDLTAALKNRGRGLRILFRRGNSLITVATE